jgi:hypothetical protein
MRHRLATFAAVAIFALALGAAPVLADSRGDNHGDRHGDDWVVVFQGTTDMGAYVGTDLGGMLDCSTTRRDSTYTLVSGFVDQVEKYRGALDPSNVAVGPVEAVETWTLRDAKVRSDQTHRVYRITGSSRVDIMVKDGGTLDAGPFISGSFVQEVRVAGARDGRSFTQVMDPKTQIPVMVSDHGTCSNLQLGLN